MRTANDKAAKGAAGTSALARLWARCKRGLSGLNKQITVIIGLPVVGVLTPVVVGHFQYLSAHSDKVREVGAQQTAAAEKAFTDVSAAMSRAITLQQLLYFNYRDALNAKIDGDDRTLEAKNARALYPQYDELRTALRENIDLMARQVEITLDWASDPDHNDAHGGIIGVDPMSRIALGEYNFDCDNKKYMPNFETGHADLPPTAEMLAANPEAAALRVDWNSTKHQLLTLYYCFEGDHKWIAAARAWAANSTVNPAANANFIQHLDDIQQGFDREALRLNAFMTLAASAFGYIHVKFRPRVWCCHVPLLREVVDAYSKRCSPIRTAENASAS